MIVERKDKEPGTKYSNLVTVTEYNFWPRKIPWKFPFYIAFIIRKNKDNNSSEETVLPGIQKKFLLG